jgi:putative ABC transport system ATP-binding protein
VGIVFQQFNLIPTLDARANVSLPAMLDGLSRSEILGRAECLLDLLGLAHRLRHRPDALSGGEQQRVAIARALLFEPQVLLADEPTGNLDSESSEQLWRLLGRIAEERSITVVMVTHEPAAAIHCRRVFVLRDGRIEDSFDVASMDSARLAARYQRVVGPRA